MAKAKRLTPGREGYKILFTENTVIMNKQFAAAAAKYGSKENKLIRDIRNDFPGMTEVIVSGRERDSAKTHTRLTYANMVKYMESFDNSEQLIAMFERVKVMSAPLASPYQYVCDWFEEQFPNYKDIPVFGEDKSNPDVKAPVGIENYKTKVQAAKERAERENALEKVS